jgi:hypothetical protein
LNFVTIELISPAVISTSVKKLAEAEIGLMRDPVFALGRSRAGGLKFIAKMP